jgi:hypothetical protein
MPDQARAEFLSRLRASRTPRAQGMAILLGMFFIVGVLGGCGPSGAGKGSDNSDAPEVEHCSLRTRACHNGCYKLDLDVNCHACCDESGLSCRKGEHYSFNQCPDRSKSQALPF